MADTTNRISSWHTDPANNDAAPPAGAPEGMAPGAVNNVIREDKSVHRTQWNDAEWFQFLDGTPNATASFVSSNQFKIANGADASSYYHVGRRVKIVGTSTVYANITAVSYSAGETTVTIDGTISNESITVSAGILSAVNHSIPEKPIQDIVGAMVSSNTETNITVTYQDSDGTLDFSVDSVAWDDVTGKPSTFTPSSHSHTAGDLPSASTSAAGVVQLNNTTNSTSTTQAATAAALKAVNDAVAASGSGDLLSTNNLSDLANASTARGNLGVAIGSDVQAYSAVLASTTASFTTADKSKLDGIASGANNYVHPTTAGDKHIPSGGSSYDALVYSANGTAQWSTTSYNAHGQRTVSTAQPSGGADGDIWYVYE